MTAARCAHVWEGMEENEVREPVGAGSLPGARDRSEVCMRCGLIRPIVDVVALLWGTTNERSGS